MTNPTALVLMSSCAVVIVMCVLTFLGWRLVMLDREVRQHYHEFLRFQQEMREDYQHTVRALEARLQVTQASLHEIADGIDSVTPWARWWASELAHEVQQ